MSSRRDVASHRVSGWRKLAGSTWGRPNDPQFYGEPAGQVVIRPRLTLTASLLEYCSHPGELEPGESHPDELDLAAMQERGTRT
jgi:hypothetical protein